MDQSGKKHHTNVFSFLPREIVFTILLHLPAPFLWQVARCVCRSWFNIISDPDFINAHFVKSNDVLLIKEFAEPHHARYLGQEGGRLRPGGAGTRFIFPGLPSNSCRGLCIFLCSHAPKRLDPFNHPRSMDLCYFGTLYVANPMTRQIQRLTSLTGGRFKCFLLAYIEQMREYKAVCVFQVESTFNLLTCPLRSYASWKKHSYVPETTLVRISNLSSVSVGDLLYVLEGDTTIAVINLHEETFGYIEFPHGIILKGYGLQKKGNYISCMVHQKDHLGLWMLRETEWFEVCKIDNARAIKELSDCSWSPIGWLDNTLILAGRSRLFFWVYNADTGKAKECCLNEELCWRSSVVHRNSLAKW